MCCSSEPRVFQVAYSILILLNSDITVQLNLFSILQEEPKTSQFAVESGAILVKL